MANVSQQSWPYTVLAGPPASVRDVPAESKRSWLVHCWNMLVVAIRVPAAKQRNSEQSSGWAWQPPVGKELLCHCLWDVLKEPLAEQCKYGTFPRCRVSEGMVQRWSVTLCELLLCPTQKAHVLACPGEGWTFVACKVPATALAEHQADFSAPETNQKIKRKSILSLFEGLLKKKYFFFFFFFRLTKTFLEKVGAGY